MASKLDRTTLISLSGLSMAQFLRMTGIFFIVPLIGVYASKYTSNEFLIGLSLGSYEISMAIMQIPSGYLSKKIGRKNYIYLGLSFFVLGNFVSFFGNNIFILIAGRFVAGLGAISTPVASIAIDLVPEDRRNTAMAITGLGIGFAFLGGIGLSPFIAIYIGIRNFFLISAILGTLAVFIIRMIREPSQKIERNIGYRKKDHRNYFIFAGSFLISSAAFMIFLSIQINFVSFYGLYHYAAILFFSILISGILAISVSEVAYRKKHFNIIALSLILAIAGIAAVYFGLLFRLDYIICMFALIPFFTGFSIYEISIIPLFARVLNRNENNISYGVFYAFQYSGNGFGALLQGSLGFLILKSHAVFFSFTVAMAFGLASGILFIYSSSGIEK